MNLWFKSVAEMLFSFSIHQIQVLSFWILGVSLWNIMACELSWPPEPLSIGFRLMYLLDNAKLLAWPLAVCSHRYGLSGNFLNNKILPMLGLDTCNKSSYQIGSFLLYLEKVLYASKAGTWLKNSEKMEACEERDCSFPDRSENCCG